MVDVFKSPPVFLGTAVKNREVKVSTRDQRIDQFRFLAFLGVFMIHFVALWGDKHPLHASLAFKGLSFVGRFAVPFFFITAGSFLKFQQGQIVQPILRYAKRLLLPFLFWVVVYWLAEVMSDPAHSFDDVKRLEFYWTFVVPSGLGTPLWFLPSLFLCIAMFVIGSRFLSPEKIVLVSLAFFAAGLILTPYAPAVWGATNPFHIDARNGPFFGLVFLAIGACYKQQLRQASLKTGLLLFLSGLILQGAEAAFLKIQYGSYFLNHDFVLGTLLVGVGSFIVAIRIPFQSPLLASLGRMTMGLYVVHVLFLQMSIHFVKMETFSGELSVIVLSLASTIGFVWILNRWEQTRALAV